MIRSYEDVTLAVLKVIWSGRPIPSYVRSMTSLVQHLQAVAFRIGNRLALMSPTLIIAALIAASPALAARCPGQFYRVRLDECVSLSSPLARPYLYAANAGRINDRPPEADPPVTVDPPTADPPPDEVDEVDEVDEAAWHTLPLLRAAEARWAAMVSPLRDETQPRDPWPWLSVYGLSKRPQQQ